jgi:2-polyprenyl-3-methyl-5-hydroxy-6-metoxy-1,4-benzoquinol methylase
MSTETRREAPSDRLREAYERRAELEYAHPAVLPDPAVNRKFERILAALSEALPCERFLDAGCGDGRYLAALAWFAERPAQIVGTDISDRILITAKRAVAQTGVDAEFVRANLEELPFPDDAFDVVLCTQVLEHLLDPRAGLRELARVAAPGGTLIVSTDNRRALVSKALNAPRALFVRALRLTGRRRLVDFPHASFGLREFVALVRGAGLSADRVETFRFHITGAGRRVQRLLNRVDKALPAHRLGDIVLVIARKPRP